MKVYQINVTGNLSTGKIATDLATLLIEKNSSCRIAYGRGKKPARIDCYKIGSLTSVLYHVIMARIFDKSGYYSNTATIRLIEDIKKYNPDIIHLHNIHGYYINVFILFNFLKMYKKCVVWTLHDCWSFTGHCAYFSYI